MIVIADLTCYNCTFNDLYHAIPTCAVNDSIPNDKTPCNIGCVKMEVDLASKFNNFSPFYQSYVHQ